MEWISVKDRLPIPREVVIAVLKNEHGKSISTVGIYWGNGSFSLCHFSNENASPTFWMPLPEPPKEDERSV